ncbi:hypothetical protein PQX77_013371 [Marasmius sp. AFHP31]|nr:hypothetical protein PQX77_013371 [Marasmius sp. AFHP31]
MSTTNSTDYFWDFVIFQVEDQLFKVPKLRFADNPHPPFHEIFNGPREGTFWELEEGESPDRPIVLEQIAKVDFQRFLDALYPKPQYIVDTSPNDHTSDVAETEKWFSVLKLSSLWNFIPMRKTAIHHLSQLSISASFTPIDYIVAGKEHGVLHWFLKGVIPIAGSHTSEIVHTDARRVGVDIAVSLYHLKGNVRSSVRGWASLGVGREEAVLEVLTKGIWDYFMDDVREIISKASVYQDTPLGRRSDRSFHSFVVDGFEPFKFRWEVSQESEIIMYRD